MHSSPTKPDRGFKPVESKPNLTIIARPTLSQAEREQAMALILKESFIGPAIAAITTGVFMVGFALQFKASNLFIGLMTALPWLAQLLQLPTIYLLQRVRSRKRVTVIASILSRLCLLPMVLTPFLPSEKISLLVFALGFLGYTGFGAVSNCAWNAWLKDIVPTADLGSFFSKRLACIAAVTILVIGLGGWFISLMRYQAEDLRMIGYSGLFLVAFLIGMAGLGLLKRIPEPTESRAEFNQSLPLLETLKKPLQNRNFRSLLAFMASWHFAVNLATPFFTVYMLTLLDYPMAVVTMMAIICQVANMLSLRIWGALADRLGNKAVLKVCAPLYLFCILSWTFTTLPETHAMTFPLIVVIHLLLGIATAGVTLANGNIAMKLAPADDPTAYLAANSFAASLAAGTAPILGGLFADVFARQELSLVLQWNKPGADMVLKTLDFHSWDFFFALAFIFGMYAICKLKAVKEGEKVGKRTVIREFAMELQHHSFGCVSWFKNHRLLAGRITMGSALIAGCLSLWPFHR